MHSNSAQNQTESPHILPENVCALTATTAANSGGLNVFVCDQS